MDVCHPHADADPDLVMRRLLVLVLLAVVLPAAPAAADEDVDFYILYPGVHSFWLRTTIGGQSGAGFQSNAPIGAKVAVTIDISGVDKSRATVEITGKPCEWTGQIARCEWDIPHAYATAGRDLLITVPAGIAPGSAGVITIRGERLDKPDLDTSNNTSKYYIDARVPGYSTFSLTVADARGSVGDTVTVPVTVRNRGPNVLHEVRFSHPLGGGGKDLVGGDGCAFKPVIRCDVWPVEPGQTRVLNLRFKIRRCFQPVRTDPEFGASVMGVLPLEYNFSDRSESPMDTEFEITVNGCQQSTGNGSAPGPSASALPSATPSTEPSAPHSGEAIVAGPESTEEAEPQRASQTLAVASRGFAGAFLLIAATLVFVRFRQRHRGL